MLRRASLQMLSLSLRSDVCAISTSRAAIHTAGIQMAKKKTDPPAASAATPAKGKQQASKPSKVEGSYPSGEMFFSYDIYSFYDIENDMAKDRIEQPSSKPLTS